ncbi:cation:proton antiporter [Micromonospora sp. WMMD998]|uniref:cation:proton antiporter domain-containing protein n=1 Tax=Micromonospora sp. WMMD998 TaxID=3016092 RepID=UPI002499F575|nr:cation:proton antiporter [Micromonospora sp. WMMD998]WFE41118.1 cation:proton antiporter [Micromonospora sp. WMMD998]
MGDANPAEWRVTVAIGGIGLLLVVVTLFVTLGRRLRQPAVVGEMTAGIVLGPSVLGLVSGDLPETLFPLSVRPYLHVVSQIGVLLFMFVIGWEFDRALFATHRRRAALVWVISLLVPMSLGVILALLLYRHSALAAPDGTPLLGFVVFIGVAMSITAFPVLARIIVDRGLQGHTIGPLALALAAADDVLAWCALAVSVALVTFSGIAGYLSVVGWTLLYLAVLVTVVRPLAKWAARRLPSTAAPYVGAVLAGAVFLSAFATSAIGIHAIFGAFCLGLMMPRESDAGVLRQAIVPLRQIGLVLMPVFFIVTGLSVDLTTLSGPALLLTVVIVVVACVGKLGGVGLSARLSGMSARESIALGLLMNTRGLTELVVLNVGFSLGLLTVQLFSAMVVMALFTTAMTTPLIGAVLRGGAVARALPSVGKDRVERPTSALK